MGIASRTVALPVRGLTNPTSPIGTRAAAAGTIAHGVARMVTHAMRSAAIVAAVAAGGALAHGVASVVGDGVVGCLHCICLSIQTMQCLFLSVWFVCVYVVDK